MYTRQTWADGQSGNTPLSSARLNTMETGIQDQSDRVGSLETALSPAVYRANSRGNLLGWDAAAASRDFSAVNILVQGDSVTEGMGASQYGRRWVKQLEVELTARMPVAGLTVPGFDTVQGWQNALTNSYTPPMVKTGVASTDYFQPVSFAWGRRGFNIRTSSGAWSTTFTGTSFDLIYPKTANSGVLRVVVDGGAPVLVDGFNGSNTYGNRWNSGALTAGTHTVTVTRDSSSSGSRIDTIFDGIAYYNGDENKGFHVWDGGHYGWKASDYNAQSFGGVATPQADLLIIEMGLNDASVVSAAQFQSDLDAMTTSTLAAMAPKVPALVFVATWAKTGITTSNWSNYVQSIYAVAANHGGYVIDMTLRMPAISASPTTDSAMYGLYYDTTHPSDRGHKLLASVVAEALVSRP